MKLKYLPYKEIDKSKWDECIKKSSNGLIYAESVYLDHMASNWDGIVMNNYEAVMPLAWRKKWGISYLYQPAFIQQGGIFSTGQINENIIKDFIELAASRFRFAEFTLNYQNISPIQPQFLRNNFVLQLENSYEKNYNNYNQYIRQRLKRAEKFDLKYIPSSDINEVIDLYHQLYAKKLKNLSKTDILNIKKLCEHLKKTNRAIVRKVVKRDTNELLAAVLMLRDDKRLYNIASCIVPAGKKQLANYYLYNNIINEFSGEKIILDFEGSDIPGIAYFYEKFTNENQQYPFIKWNRLSKLIKIFKQ